MSETGNEKGRVRRAIMDALAHGPIHMTLVDPGTSGDEDGARIAAEATRLGSHAIMVGGSTDVTSANLDALVAAIKNAADVPVILFPSSAGALTPRVDAVYFLSTLNSTDPRVLVREQARGAPVIHALNVEPIGLGYVIVEPGMTVGDVSRADCVPRTKDGVDEAVGYALAAQYFGMPLVYLEAGSGAPAPVPPDMVRAVKSVLDVPLIVGGGIRDAGTAATVLDAGADVLVTGTVAESRGFDTLGEIIGEVLKRRGTSPRATAPDR